MPALQSTQQGQRSQCLHCALPERTACKRRMLTVYAQGFAATCLTDARCTPGYWLSNWAYQATDAETTTQGLQSPIWTLGELGGCQVCGNRFLHLVHLVLLHMQPPIATDTLPMLCHPPLGLQAWSLSRNLSRAKQLVPV